MESSSDDRFVVFVRTDRSQTARPDVAERALATCTTYEEARRVRDEVHRTSRECIIRYIGPTGGGD